MLDFFRGTVTCDALLDYIDHLPSDSAYMAAIADDDEYADMVPSQLGPDATKAGAPSLTEFGPQVRALAALYDQLNQLISVQIARAGKNPPRRDPYPRPVTALERARKRRQFANHNHLVARLIRR